LVFIKLFIINRKMEEEIEELYERLKEICLDTSFMQGMYEEETRELFSKLVERKDELENSLQTETDLNTIQQMYDELDSKSGGILENGHFEVEEEMLTQDELDELEDNTNTILDLIGKRMSELQNPVQGGRRKKSKKSKKAKKTRKAKKSKKSKKTRKH
jgi:hypothetical protein